MAENEVTHPLDVFHDSIWEKIFTSIKSPNDIQNVCTASAYFAILMHENGRKGVAQFGRVYPLIRPYLGPELELLTRDFTETAPNIFLERAESYKVSMDNRVLGKLRKVCPYWRQIVWNDSLRRIKAKYKEYSYPPNYPIIPGYPRYLILSPIDGPFGPENLKQTKKQAWHYARIQLDYVREHNARLNIGNPHMQVFVSTLYPEPDPALVEKIKKAETREELDELVKLGCTIVEN